MRECRSYNSFESAHVSAKKLLISVASGDTSSLPLVKHRQKHELRFFVSC